MAPLSVSNRADVALPKGKRLPAAVTRRLRPIMLLAMLQGGLGVSIAGCASYRVGNCTLYATDAATVYVPMIESDSFRRDLGERLTEAVIKEIGLKTPYKTVGTPDADSILAARLVGDQKHVTVENQNDDPRAVEIALAVQVTWHNRRREPLATTTIPLPAELYLPIHQTAPLLAEGGQSMGSQQQVAIERLAQQIVSTMEEPW